MDSSAEIADLAQQLFAHLMECDPLGASLMGDRTYDSQLTTLKREHEEQLAAKRRTIRDGALAVDATTLSEQDLLTRDVIISQTTCMDYMFKADATTYTVSAFPVAPASSLLAMLRMVGVTSGEQAAHYLDRLKQIPRYLVEATSELARGRSLGRHPVKALTQGAIDQINQFLNEPASAMTPTISGDWSGQEAFLEDIRVIAGGEVAAAYASYRDALVADSLPVAREDEFVGLVHLDGGLAMYEGLVKAHTTTDLTPEYLHNRGLEIVAQIHADFAELGQKVFGTADVTKIFEHMTGDSNLRWETSEQMLDAVTEVVRRAELAAPEWFGRIPSVECAISPIPEVEAEGSGMAYYMPAAMDGSRAGTYYQNVSHPTERRIFDLESVAFHEAVPGHHFQLQLALEMAGMPAIRRMTLFTAYAEGWGLYSERLAFEMGLYSSDVQLLGMLAADVWRASRLVVDTGMHAFGWSRQRAIDYMVTNTPASVDEITSEINRYIAMPGQAVSYMTGRLELQRLRSELSDALGDAFDLKDFHDAVLGSGALPLDVLARHLQSSFNVGGEL
jgi:uncharacterized protein (DUF885 family)